MSDVEGNNRPKDGEGDANAGATGSNAPPTHAPEKVQEVFETAHKVVDRVADQAHATVAQAGERASDAYGRAAEKVDGIAGVAGPFIREKPYLATALAVAGGIIVGMLLSAGGPKIIYVKPRD